MTRPAVRNPPDDPGEAVDPLLEDDRITAVGLLMEAQAAVESALARTLDAHGLSPQVFEVLIRLGRTPGRRLRMSELAAVMTSITPSGLTRLIDRVEAAGFVERRSCEEDRRGAWAQLTPAGAAKLGEVVPDHLADIDRVYANLFSARELRAFTDQLRRLRDANRIDSQT